MRIKYFPGANTSHGFVSKFQYIAPPWEKEHFTYVLKGGPGTGKNTLMKKLSAYASAAGYSVEEFSCASDPESLDAIRIIEKRIIMLDGTAPHIVDPIYPGAADKIVDLGFFKDVSKLQSKKERIKRLTAENKSHYKFAYSYLSASEKLKESALNSAESAIDKESIFELLLNLLSKVSESGTLSRYLFAKTFTPLGNLDYTDKIVRDKTTYYFGGLSGFFFLKYANELLINVRKTVLLDSVIQGSPMGIILHDTPVALIWDISHNENTEYYIKELPQEIKTNLKIASELENLAAEEIKISKEIHDEIESVYKNHVDFEKVEKKAEEIIEEIGF